MTDSGDPDHPQNDLAAIFGKADRVDAYQYSPKNAISSALDLPNMGASLNYPGDLIENIKSLADNGWTYSPQWYSATREAHGWQTSGGHPRLDIVNFSAHHIIPGLVPQEALKKDILVHQYLVNKYLLGNPEGTKFGGGYFPAETCFSGSMRAYCYVLMSRYGRFLAKSKCAKRPKFMNGKNKYS